MYLEIGTEDEKYRVKSFRLLMRIAVEECDFFEALHLLNRAGQAKVPEHKIIDWKWLIEGVNEMIKKKFLAALEQL